MIGTSGRDAPKLPCVLFEDDHLLVVNKPPALNTHAPAPFAGEGIYDWLRHRERRWAHLAIIHRLDKGTSGVLLFSKSTHANRELTRQFATRGVSKKYLLLTDRPPKQQQFRIECRLVRAGERYQSTEAKTGDVAITGFRVVRQDAEPKEFGLLTPGRITVLEAEPLTGRTHQIRVHAAMRGLPILGDTLYGGSEARRLFLHAAQLAVQHPATREPICFTAPAQFERDPIVSLREAFLDDPETNAYRMVHGATDGWPGFYVDRFGEHVLVQSERHPEQTAAVISALHHLRPSSTSIWHKRLTRNMHAQSVSEASPQHLWGQVSRGPFAVRENGLQYEVRFDEGYSVGLFLDQRENRYRLLTRHVAADFELAFDQPKPELLNTFAYTCSFSVCAARAGFSTTSLDLSRKYLDWGRRNFELNALPTDGHDFVYGDVFDWLSRWKKRGRTFDLVMLDPPTFSQSRESGIFRAEKDYGSLVKAALAVLKPDGVLFASSNAAGWRPEQFMQTVEEAIRATPRKLLQQKYFPQPLDFPMSKAEPGYLKTAWFRVGSR